MKITQYLILIPLLFTGCVSRHHLGVKQFDPTHVACHSIGTKVISQSKEFEEKVTKLVSINDLNALKSHFSKKLKEKLSDKDLETIKAKINSYQFSGVIKPKNLIIRSINIGPENFWDPFTSYDFVVGSYLLEGKTKGNLSICFVKKDEKYDLVGMLLTPINKKRASDENTFKYLFLDYIDSEESIFCPCLIFMG
ncbi:MAG: hypothetical protein ACKVQC_01730 [Elusimicrobiota bacterium]